MPLSKTSRTTEWRWRQAKLDGFFMRFPVVKTADGADRGLARREHECSQKILRSDQDGSVGKIRSRLYPRLVPEGIRCEGGWRYLRVLGTMDFSMTGIVASLTTPLANAGVSVFVISTFDTDYLLIKEADLEQALAALRTAGHVVG